MNLPRQEFDKICYDTVHRVHLNQVKEKERLQNDHQTIQSSQYKEFRQKECNCAPSLRSSINLMKIRNRSAASSAIKQAEASALKHGEVGSTIKRVEENLAASMDYIESREVAN